MAKTDIAVLLALGAAVFIAICDVIHQRSAHAVTDEPVTHIELFMRLLRDGKWWLGSVVAAVGFALQALMVTSLLFALPINALFTRRRVTRWEWTWAALLAAAVAVIVTVGNPTAGHSLASLETWTVVSGALWGVFAVLTKGVVERLDGGLLALLRTPELYVWVLVAIAGAAWQQSSFRAGALTASLPTMTVAVAVMVAATVALARGEAAVATRQPA